MFFACFHDTRIKIGNSGQPSPYKFRNDIMEPYLPLRIEILPKTLCFKQPAGTSRGVYHKRKTWYIRITSEHVPQLYGMGECAPLFDLSPDYTSDYEEQLWTFCKQIASTGRVDTEGMRQYPSMLFGLETAILSARASLRGDYLQIFDTPFSRGETGIPINGLVWMGNYKEMMQRMEEKLNAGFRCIKLKIGAIDFESELALIRALRSRFSATDVELRVDANGAFSIEDAPRRIEALAKYSLHSIEQPIRAGAWKEMSHLCRNTPLPIALDEELIGIHEKDKKTELLDNIRPQYIVIKPTLHGGLSGAEEWIKAANEREIGSWVTSALESNLGLNAIAQWTSHLNHDTPVSMPQGLGTGALFTSNFPEAPLAVIDDHLWIADERTRRFRMEVKQVQKNWRNKDETMCAKTSGSTGRPQIISVKKQRMAASARRTCMALQLPKGCSALLCMPVEYIAGRMMVIRAEVAGLRLICIPPSLHPLASVEEPPFFVAMTPMQAYESLSVEREADILKRTPKIIIGGGGISNELHRMLASCSGEVWSTYGMTETLSHIALRRLNGQNGENHYFPLPDVSLSLSQDGCLIINDKLTCDAPIKTNDIAEIFSDGSFRIIGRRDNVICSGGLKFHIEDLEKQLAVLPFPIQITALRDARLGEAVTLLYVSKSYRREEVERLCRNILPAYAVPRYYFCVTALPITETGKPARAEARRLAALFQEKE